MLGPIVAMMIVAISVGGLRMPQPPPAEPPEGPNIVLLVIDDVPYLGDDFFRRLPNFKSIFVDHGLNFTNSNGNDPLCCPGRANIYTGQWAHHHGVIRNDARLFDARTSIFTELRNSGYYTFISGKWFNLTDKLATKLPLGFDHAALMSGLYYNYKSWSDNVEELHGTAEDDYSTDFFAERSLEYLRTAPPNKPIFATLTPFAAHFGEDASGVSDHLLPPPAPRHLDDERCTGVPRFKLANFNERDVSDKPLWVRSLRRLPAFYKGGYPLEKFCRALMSVDEQIGRLAAELKRQGRFDNTLWLLTGDNGWGGGSHRWLKKKAPYTTGVPLYISWPAGRGDEPGKTDFPVTNVDFAPTLCELAGCTMGPFANGHAVDGQSFAGLIAPSISDSVPSRTAILTEHTSDKKVPPWRSIMTTPEHPLGRWHFVQYTTTGEMELYDISGGPCFGWQVAMPGDPCELNNLAYVPEYAAIRDLLALELVRLWGGSGSTN